MPARAQPSTPMTSFLLGDSQPLQPLVWKKVVPTPGAGAQPREVHSQRRLTASPASDRPGREAAESRLCFLEPGGSYNGQVDRGVHRSEPGRAWARLLLLLFRDHVPPQVFNLQLIFSIKPE